MVHKSHWRTPSPVRWIPCGCIAVFLGLSLIWGGCAAMQENRVMDMERTLAASGFRVKFADTPEKMEHLKDLTQRKLVPHSKEGKVFYIYADAEYCKCLYVGDEEAYQRYQELALQRKIAEDQRMAAEMNRDASMNWGMWGPWRPWGMGPWY